MVRTLVQELNIKLYESRHHHKPHHYTIWAFTHCDVRVERKLEMSYWMRKQQRRPRIHLEGQGGA